MNTALAYSTRAAGFTPWRDAGHLPANANAGAAALPANADALASARILVVDDSEADRRLLVDFLRRQGCRLYVGDNGHDGYEKARYVQPDLIVMDIRMPGCDGIAACRLLKADPATARIPVVFLSAASLPEDRVLGLTEGAVDYIVKPFNFDEVRLRLEIQLRALRRAAQQASTAQARAAQAQAQPQPAQQPRPRSSVDEVVFRAASRILTEDLANPPQLAALARQVGTNAKRLNDAFKACAGATVFEYLHEARMREACKLLRDTHIEISTIAADLGYGSACNFSTAFRQRHGVSPRQYRKSPGSANADEAAAEAA